MPAAPRFLAAPCASTMMVQSDAKLCSAILAPLRPNFITHFASPFCRELSLRLLAQVRQSVPVATIRAFCANGLIHVVSTTFCDDSVSVTKFHQATCALHESLSIIQDVRNTTLKLANGRTIRLSCTHVAVDVASGSLLVASAARRLQLFRLEDGSLVKELGQHPSECLGDWNYGGIADPLLCRGYQNAYFLPGGGRIIANWRSGLDSEKGVVLDVATGQTVSRFPSCAYLAASPDFEALAMLWWDVGAVGVKFGHVEGRGDSLKMDIELDTLWNDHACSVTFSPTRDFVAIVVHDECEGDTQPISTYIYRWPSLAPCVRVDAERTIPLIGTDLDDCKLIPAPERGLFVSHGARFLFPCDDGFLAMIDTCSGNEIQRWKLHDELITACDLILECNLLVTGDIFGNICLYEMDK